MQTTYESYCSFICRHSWDSSDGVLWICLKQVVIDHSVHVCGSRPDDDFSCGNCLRPAHKRPPFSRRFVRSASCGAQFMELMVSIASWAQTWPIIRSSGPHKLAGRCVHLALSGPSAFGNCAEEFCLVSADNQQPKATDMSQIHPTVR